MAAAPSMRRVRSSDDLRRKSAASSRTIGQKIASEIGPQFVILPTNPIAVFWELFSTQTGHVTCGAGVAFSRCDIFACSVAADDLRGDDHAVCHFLREGQHGRRLACGRNHSNDLVWAGRPCVLQLRVRWAATWGRMECHAVAQLERVRCRVWCSAPSYVDPHGHVITSRKKIIVRYLTSYFIVDIVSLLPFDIMLDGDSTSKVRTACCQSMPCCAFWNLVATRTTASNSAVPLRQIARLARVIRLLRLLRLTKLFKYAALCGRGGVTNALVL